MKAYITPATNVRDLMSKEEFMLSITSQTAGSDYDVQTREEEDYGDSFDFEW